ncbi:hypothetical protein SAMN04488583_1907 [Mycobacterium sp. 88mf]|nr:hypothetical protein SAMN04488583_1907 [Mycobacterium sp. 88mf]SFF38934.1 hypothetical protein SAMN04488582_102244 [Mycobacterium sp. 455mf]
MSGFATIGILMVLVVITKTLIAPHYVESSPRCTPSQRLKSRQLFGNGAIEDSVRQALGDQPLLHQGGGDRTVGAQQA